MCFLLYLSPIIALLAYTFQLRAAERRRIGGGGVIGMMRGTLHGLCVAGLGFSCPFAFELTMELRPRVLGLMCGACFAIGSFVLALTLADKVFDMILASFLADSLGPDALGLRDLARLEVPEAAVFSTLILGWVAIEMCSR
jgi:hypothetical protein